MACRRRSNGAALWTLLLNVNISTTGVDAAYACLVVQLALAGIAFAILPHRGEHDEFVEFDPVASIVLVGFALLAIVILAGGSADASVRSSWVVASAAAMAILAFVGAQAAPSGRRKRRGPGLVALGAMRFWGLVRAYNRRGVQSSRRGHH